MPEDLLMERIRQIHFRDIQIIVAYVSYNALLPIHQVIRWNLTHMKVALTLGFLNGAGLYSSDNNPSARSATLPTQRRSYLMP